MLKYLLVIKAGTKVLHLLIEQKKVNKENYYTTACTLTSVDQNMLSNNKIRFPKN